MLNKYNKVLAFFLAFIVTFSFNMNMSQQTEFRYSFDGYNMMVILMLFLLTFLFSKVLKIREKRLIIISSILSFVLSSFLIIGHSLNNYGDLSGVITSNLTLFKNGFRFIGYFITITSIVMVIYSYFKERKVESSKERKFFTSNKRSFILVWILIFCAWLPYFLHLFPGILTPDSLSQVLQSIGEIGVTSHHPPVHTFFIYLAMNIGNRFGDYNLGVAIYSIIQMLFVSAVFSFSLYYMAKKNVSTMLRVITLLFFALYPIHAFYSITMWKDVPFAAMMLLVTICMLEIVTNTEKFLYSIKKNIIFILVMVLAILLRNNAFYALLLSIPIILIIYRKYVKRLSILFAAIIMIQVIITGPIYNMFNVEPGSIREALSVPLQQVARVHLYHYEHLTDEDKETIYLILPVENLGDYYNPIISDPVKNHFHNENFASYRNDFFRTWFSLGLRFPRTYIESFLMNSYGYWYPEARHWIIGIGILDNDLGMEQNPIVEIGLIDEVDVLFGPSFYPVVSMLFSIGLAFWIILGSFVYVIYQKRYKLIIVFLPILTLWFTTLASPVFAEYRYVYSMFTCLPLLVITAMEIKTKQEKKNKKRAQKTMMKKVLSIYKKYEEIFNYLVAGVSSMIISISTFTLFVRVLNIHHVPGNILSWIITVIFAYCMYRWFVFKSKEKNKLKEFIIFIEARIFTLLLEVGILILLIDLLNLDNIVSKVIAQVIIVVSNYLISKFIVFRKK